MLDIPPRGAVLMDSLQRSQKKYRQSPRGKYQNQKTTTRNRGISFLLSFNEWWDVWQKSGKWDQRGTKNGQFKMLRIGDTGAYELGNVFIGPVQRNYNK